jgi:hypothetical protein
MVRVREVSAKGIALELRSIWINIKNVTSEGVRCEGDLVEHGDVGEIGHAGNGLEEPEALDWAAVKVKVQKVAQAEVDDADGGGCEVGAALLVADLRAWQRVRGGGDGD